MFGSALFRRDYPALEGAKVFLRMPAAEDYAAWAELREESRAFLTPWEPVWSHDELSRRAYRQRLRQYQIAYEQGRAVSFFLFCKDEGNLLGGITLSNIRRGAAQTATIGYWMGERYAGKGAMFDALQCVIPYAFDTLRLHRLEAACIPSNQRSVRLLEKAGFQREGLLRSYLCINGSWQDHYLYARIVGDTPIGR